MFGRGLRLVKFYGVFLWVILSFVAVVVWSM